MLPLCTNKAGVRNRRKRGLPIMCDLPPVDNVIMPDDVMYAFLSSWSERIQTLGRLQRTRYKDEALVLCCCYIQAVGGWLRAHENPLREEHLLNRSSIIQGWIYSER